MYIFTYSLTYQISILISQYVANIVSISKQWNETSRETSPQGDREALCGTHYPGLCVRLRCCAPGIPGSQTIRQGIRWSHYNADRLSPSYCACRLIGYISFSRAFRTTVFVALVMSSRLQSENFLSKLGVGELVIGRALKKINDYITLHCTKLELSRVA